MSDLVFPCNGCGLCCRKAGSAVKTARIIQKAIPDDDFINEVSAFPFDILEDGTCSKLGADNKCMVYENRPDICIISKTHEKHHKGKITLEEYYGRTADTCNEFMQEAGMDESNFIQWPKV